MHIFIFFIKAVLSQRIHGKIQQRTISTANDLFRILYKPQKSSRATLFNKPFNYTYEWTG